MPRPDLSVVIVGFRCAQRMDTCLTTLADHHDDLRMEVIVVDNASGDGTAEVARAHHDVTVIKRLRNDGFAVAANEGMAAARGRVVLVLNPDTEVAPGALRLCVDAIDADASIGVLTARVVDSRGRIDPRCHRRFPTAWSSLCFLTGADRVLPDAWSGGYLMRGAPEDRATDVDAVSGAFMLMRADSLHRIGGFDQQFFMYAEDIDLCMRFRAAGMSVRYWPGATVTHHGHGSHEHGRRSPQADAAAFRTMAPLMAKHRRGIRGTAAAVLAAIGGELMLAASRMRRRAYP